MDNQLDVIVTIGGGADGYTPVIGANANWWINGFDTGIKADYSREESLRAQEEVLRVSAESARIKAEELRASNELTREREFELMQNAVSDAIASLQQLSTSVEADESSRARNETLRNQSEADRASSEAYRELNETNRSAEETKRIESETTRNQQEESRKSAETNRVTEENKRKDAETIRGQQEEARKLSEANRISEENKRIEAERLRAEKDAGRDNKIANVENKTDQLEQDLNVVRGDVQGLSSDYNMLNKFWFKDASEFTISFWVISSPIVTAKDIFIFGDSVVDTGSSILGGYNGNPISFIQFNPRKSYVSNTISLSKGFYAITFNNGNAQWYFNGTPKPGGLETGFNTTQTIYKLGRNWLSRNFTVGNIRTFNTSLTATQIEALYNQGRCDEVRLGDEWRKPDTSNVYDITNNVTNGWNLVNAGGSVITVSGGFINVTQASSSPSYPRFELANTKWNSGISKFICEYENIQGVSLATFAQNVLFEETIVTTDGWKRYIIVVSSHSHTSNIFWFQSNQSNPNPNPITFKVRRLERTSISVINEYLPNNLTPTKWIDSGINKNDIALTAPTFSYIRPYKHYNYGSGAPTTPPEAAFTEYGDIVSGNIWKCRPKGSDRQFAVSDWKQINNG